MNIPCVISSNDHNNIINTIHNLNQSSNCIHEFIYFKESNFYPDNHYPFYTALVYKKGYRNPDKPISKRDIIFRQLVIEGFTRSDRPINSIIKKLQTDQREIEQQRDKLKTAKKQSH